jgi:glycosyltransferase involved in cell wall biosynthesis
MTGETSAATVVLLPFRDAERFIRPAIDGLLAQTCSDFVVVAVDDRSEDATADIITSYRDSRIVIVKAEGVGLPAALNTGLKHCPEAVLVARHDADDISFPGRLAGQVAYLHDHPDVDVLATQHELMNERGVSLGRAPAVPLDHDGIVAEFRVYNPICHGSVMVRADRLRAVGGYDPAFPLAQGFDLWVRLAQAGCRFAALPEVLYRYRRYAGSWSQRQQEEGNRLAALIRERAASL